MIIIYLYAILVKGTIKLESLHVILTTLSSKNGDGSSLFNLDNFFVASHFFSFIEWTASYAHDNVFVLAVGHLDTLDEGYLLTSSF